MDDWEGQIDCSMNDIFLSELRSSLCIVEFKTPLQLRSRAIVKPLGNIALVIVKGYRVVQ